jgi:hypothetical protein
VDPKFYRYFNFKKGSIGRKLFKRRYLDKLAGLAELPIKS